MNINLSIYDAMAHQLDQVANFNNRDRTGQIREFIKEGINRYKEENPKKWKDFLAFASEHLDHDDIMFLNEDL
jgi:metal-responsive CopG/Arc/MetJ family transcriptional regulator